MLVLLVLLAFKARGKFKAYRKCAADAHDAHGLVSNLCVSAADACITCAPGLDRKGNWQLMLMMRTVWFDTSG